MIDLDGIYNALLEAFRDFPNLNRAKFTSDVVSRGIATAGEVDTFLDNFLAVGYANATLSAADFDVMMALARSVGLTRATNGAAVIYQEMKKLVVIQIVLLESEREETAGHLATQEADKATAEFARDWIAANALGTAEQLTITVNTMNLGIQQREAGIAALTRDVAALDARIQRLQELIS